MSGPIYIVTGLPRSGTSMMMQCLESGGMAVVRSDKRDAVLRNNSDAVYRMNPVSLYEPTGMMSPAFPREHKGKAVKIVVPVVRRIAAYQGGYRVVMMRRDPEEIRQSMEAAFEGHATVAQLEAEAVEARDVLRQRRDVRNLIELQYDDVLANPASALASLGWPIDVRQAALCVAPSLKRFDRPKLVVGLSA